MDPRSSSSQQLNKKIHELAEDRLSNLPKNVIEAILSCLPLRDAFRTRILSRVWRYEWSNLPKLVFDKVNFPIGHNQGQAAYDSKLVKIIDQVLLLHRGPVQMFKLSIELWSCMDIDRWILFVSRIGISEFILHKWKGEIYKVPSCLFSCEGLTYLELNKCSLIPPASFSGFRNLRTLALECVGFSNKGIETMISNCPLLNKLILQNISGCTRVQLRAPNLVDLEIVGTFDDICFEKTPLLAKASINLLKSNGEYESLANGGICKFINLFGFLPGIKILKLLGNTYQILSAAGDVPVELATPCKLLHLFVAINFEDAQQMLAALCIFRSSLFLQMVNLESISDKNRANLTVEGFWEGQEEFNCVFSQLQILNVTEYRGTVSELKFVEFVFTNAPVLEMVKIQLNKNVSNAMVLEILTKLARFRRVSSKAELVILK